MRRRRRRRRRAGEQLACRWCRAAFSRSQVDQDEIRVRELNRAARAHRTERLEVRETRLSLAELRLVIAREDLGARSLEGSRAHLIDRISGSLTPQVEELPVMVAPATCFASYLTPALVRIIQVHSIRQRRLIGAKSGRRGKALGGPSRSQLALYQSASG